MKKGISGFPSLIYVIIIFIIVVAVLLLIYLAVKGEMGGLFDAVRNIFMGLPPEVG